MRKSDDWEDFNFTLVEPYDLWYVSNVNLDWVVTIYVAWYVHMVPIVLRVCFTSHITYTYTIAYGTDTVAWCNDTIAWCERMVSILLRICFTITHYYCIWYLVTTLIVRIAHMHFITILSAKLSTIVVIHIPHGAYHSCEFSLL